MKIFCVFLIFLISNYSIVNALTDEQAMMRFTKAVMGCNKDNAVGINELLKLQNLEIPTKAEVKCLLACAYKTMGTMNDKGLFDVDAALKFAEEVGIGNEKRLQNAKKLNSICIKVNDENVSDGDKGCERAVLMFKCVLDNAPGLGFRTRFDKLY